MFEHKYDLPNDLIDTWKKYESYKLTPYKNLTAEQIHEMNDIAQDLRVYTIESEDYNKCFDLMANMQSFIKDEFPDYINECLDKMWAEINKALGIIDEVNDWFDGIKNNITLHGWFEFDNYVMLENVDYYQTNFSDNKIVETISYNGVVFATRTTTFSGSSIIERIVVTEVDGVTKIHDKTLTTIFNSNGTIKSNVTNNL